MFNHNQFVFFQESFKTDYVIELPILLLSKNKKHENEKGGQNITPQIILLNSYKIVFFGVNTFILREGFQKLYPRNSSLFLKLSKKKGKGKN